MCGLIFHKVLEMSLIGSYCFLLVLPVRLFLIRCSRKYAYYLWFIVFFNLAVPIYPKWKFSLIPNQVVELSVGFKEKQESPIKEEDFPELGTIQYNSVQLEKNKWGNMQWREQVNQKQQIQKIIENMVCFVWALGVVVILCLNICHMAKMYQQLAKKRWESWDKEKRIAEVRGLPAPFLWGILHPIIYLPAGLCKQEKQYIIAHEYCHLKRNDFILKLMVFLVIIIHWFNPIVWAAWIIFCQDMEVSCDEEVLIGAGEEIKKQYAKSLLKYAAMQNGYLVLSVTFGEPSVKTRIKNVLYFRKHNVVITSIAGFLAVIIALGLIVHPVENGVLAANYIKTDSPKEIEDNNIIENIVGNIQQVLVGQETTPLQIEKDNAYILQHRKGYKEAEVLHIQEQDYFTPELWDKEKIDALAQRAIRELYDLTGFQVESCVYSCSDNGSFWFAKTEYNLEHSMIFYFRQFGEMEGYKVIPSMGIANARRLWFSDVQQLNIPWNIEQMGIEEAATWFLQHSAVYQGEKIVGAEPMFEPEVVKVITEDGSFYEIIMDWKIRTVSDIAGPYPKGFSH